MKETNDSSKGNTILVVDETNEVNEILFRSAFQKLIIFYTDDLKNNSESIKDWECGLVILATKDNNLATQILTVHEKGKFDILPSTLPQVDSSCLDSKTVANIVLFRFSFLKYENTLRTKLNFIVRNSLSKILYSNEFNERTVKSICKYPLNAYLLICAIENQNQEVLIDFFKSIKDFENENKIAITQASIDLINQSNCDIHFIVLFSKSVKLLFKGKNSDFVSKEIIILIDRVVRNLEIKIFTLSGVPKNLNIFLSYFDNFDEFKTRNYIQDISHKSNKITNIIFAKTLNDIFDIKECFETNIDKPIEEFSKWEISCLNSYKEISEILSSKSELNLIEKFELSMMYYQYSNYLLRGKKDQDITSLIKKYILLDESK